ncbi:MAG TPA: AAA family ATPase [Pseudobdellovibrionaceae bacterium]|jgi:AAA+ superfamily predicted ATPase|nr:AAA family ATPase [Pseudobdellovibrionaceae bacterium]
MELNQYELFETPIELPDFDFQDRLNALEGLDDVKERASKILSLLVNPSQLENWAKSQNGLNSSLVNLVLRRPPLIVFEGDVGSGKTELATTIGDLVARNHKIKILLYSLSLSTRGIGRVGEMTKLISTAFEFISSEAKKLKNGHGPSDGGIILLVDEADALAQSRELSQMHHEDKAGVNAFIRGIDQLGNGKLPVAVIMCTNRVKSLDPAIKRRASEIFTFSRPNEVQREAILKKYIGNMFDDALLKDLVKQTGPNGRAYGFTFSDLTQRLLPSIVLDAYPDRSITSDRILELAKLIIPTSPFQEANGTNQN